MTFGRGRCLVWGSSVEQGVEPLVARAKGVQVSVGRALAARGFGDEGLEKCLGLSKGVSFGKLAGGSFGAPLFKEDNRAGGQGLIEEVQRWIEDDDARRAHGFQQAIFDFLPEVRVKKLGGNNHSTAPVRGKVFPNLEEKERVKVREAVDGSTKAFLKCAPGAFWVVEAVGFDVGRICDYPWKLTSVRE